MHLKQMAARCPQSTLHSRGILRGYRWQINSRGVANVVQSDPTDVVEGIVFTVTPRDVRTLDRNEGVSRQLYHKKKIPIELVPLALDHLRDVGTVFAAKFMEESDSDYEAPKTLVPRADKGQKSSKDSSKTGKRNEIRPSSGNARFSGSASKGTSGEVADALVYLSYLYQQDGHIRREYVSRMHSAITDARKLGVTERYLRRSLYNLVYKDGLPRNDSPEQKKANTDSNTPGPPSSKEEEKRHARFRRRRHRPRDLEESVRAVHRGADRSDGRNRLQRPPGNGNEEGRSHDGAQRQEYVYIHTMYYIQPRLKSYMKENLHPR